jgi:anti-sigma factor RsiW
MTAAQARELFSEAYERELDPAQAEAFAAALAADPELARDYDAFVATLGGIAPALRGGESAAPATAAPNLLPGVQRRLRVRSRGRFYGDRFSERLGSGWLQPLPLALLLLGVLAVAWLARTALGLIAVGP